MDYWRANNEIVEMVDVGRVVEFGLPFAISPYRKKRISIMEDYVSEGWVYIMRNASMPQMVKIGWTTKEPAERAKELSIGTGVPTPFSVVRAFATKRPEKVEQMVHKSLSYCRVSPNREFFEANVPDGRHFRSDSEYDEFFGIKIQNEIEVLDDILRMEEQQREREQMWQRHDARRIAFLDDCMKRNYPDRWTEYQERLEKIRQSE